MKKHQIEEIEKSKILAENYEDTIRFLREEKEKIISNAAQLLKSCDHVNPDGTSASMDAFLYSYCSICGETDT